MTKLETLKVWLGNNCCDEKTRFINDNVIQFEMFGQTWEVWEIDGHGSLALGKMGVFLTVRNSWQAIAQYLIKYSISSECQLKRIADALEEGNEKGIVNLGGMPNV